MKIILNSFLFLLVSASQCSSTSDLVEQLQGQWMDMDDIKYGECPDFIFFHKSGRYIVFNDAGVSENYWLPITEKGNWEIKNKDIVFMKDVNKHHHNDSTILTIKNISKEELILVGISEDGEKYTKTYKRDMFSAKQMQCYNGYGSSTEKLILPPPGGATLLKLKYNLLFPNETKSSPSTLIIKDQDGHELWRKAITFKQEKELEEILLADMPEAIELTQIIFEIHTKVGWKLQAKIY
jgi:hypothetical protein